MKGNLMANIELKIRELELTKNLIRVIHYGCESWFNVKDRPVSIACIAIVDFKTREEISFSITDTIDEPEKYLLERYYKYLRESPDARYVHWNMKSSDFGFEAIDNRYRYLFNEEQPYSVPKEFRYDLDDLIAYKYGEGYMDHPKLYNLGSTYRFAKRYILSGKEEADKFASQSFGDIKRSTVEKAHLITFLCKRFLDGKLETKRSGPRVAFAKEKIDAVQIILEISRKLKTVSRQLKRRYGKRPTIEINDEYDTQNLLHSLLRIFIDDVRLEEWLPKYAGSNKRMDFLLPSHDIAIELKHSRPTMDAKVLSEELVIDIDHYKNHKSVKHLVCVVFDYDGYIANPRGLESDLTAIKDNIMVTTTIVD